MAFRSCLSLAPNVGSSLGGTTVTIEGTSLLNASVQFGSALAAQMISDTATQIIAVSPAGAAGSVDVTVTTAAARRPRAQPTDSRTCRNRLSPVSVRPPGPLWAAHGC